MRLALAAALCLLSLPFVPAAAQSLLVGNKGEDTLSIIALSSGAELARLPTGKMPHEIAISPDGKQAAVVSYGGTTIDVFDLAKRAKIKTIDLSPNQRPHGLLWLSDGRLVATAEGSESVAVVAPDGRLTSIATGQKGTHMVVVAPDNRTAYTANIGSGTVSVIDLKAGRKLRDLTIGGKPEGLALTKHGRELWVGDSMRRACRCGIRRRGRRSPSSRSTRSRSACWRAPTASWSQRAISLRARSACSTRTRARR